MSSLVASATRPPSTLEAQGTAQTGMWTKHPTWLRLISGCVYAIGIGLLAQAFIAVAQSPEAYSLFWGGLGLCFVAVVMVILSPGVRSWHIMVALALFGGALYLPTLLRSPAYPMFQDELHHVLSLELMHDLHTTQIPVTAFPIAGDYPGLEFLGLGVIAATGLPLASVVRLIPFVLHMLIPVIVYIILRSNKLAERTAACGSLVYCANTSFYFFHSVYSYETLGIVLFLFVALAATHRFDLHIPSLTPFFSAFLILTIIATIATHHASGAMTVVLLLVTLAANIVLRRAQRSTSSVAWFALVLWVSWLVYITGRTVRYLAFNLWDRIESVLAFFVAEQTSTRQLFWNSQLPLGEQLIACAYPLLVFGLIAVGAWSIVRTARRMRAAGEIPPTMTLTFGIFGPALWIMTAPLIITRSSELAYRAWPFLFLGIAFYAAHGFNSWLNGTGRGVWLQRGVLCVVLGLMLMGGIILGDNQAGRFQPTEIHAGAGPEAITPNLIAAARWLESDSGRMHLVIGNRSSGVVFADYGKQRTNLWGNWVPFYQDAQHAQAFLNLTAVDFVVVDMRDARHLPRYGSFYSSAEIFDTRLAGYDVDSPFPLDRLRKFDQMPGLQRIYDNGDIIIYARLASSK